MFERDLVDRDAAEWIRAALDGAPFPVGICAEGRLVYENSRFSDWILEPELAAPNAPECAPELPPERSYTTRRQQVRELVADLSHVLPGPSAQRFAGPAGVGVPTPLSPFPSGGPGSSRFAPVESPGLASAGVSVGVAKSATRQTRFISGGGG
ncbi:MAG TPA: hypothetical protein VFQ61_01550, partial [Polyangiaceae bacterium]|nr:hypothetical protein [Polyangiaceae bacterium]